MAAASKEAEGEDEAKDKAREQDVVLERVLCIQYPIWFKKNKVQALLDSSSEVNAMTLACGLKLGLKVYSTNIGSQKRDSSTPQTWE